MRFSFFLIIAVLFFSCKNEEKSKSIKAETKYVVKDDFQEIIDKAKLEGAILIYDLNNDTFYSNDFD